MAPVNTPPPPSTLLVAAVVLFGRLERHLVFQVKAFVDPSFLGCIEEAKKPVSYELFQGLILAYIAGNLNGKLHKVGECNHKTRLPISSHTRKRQSHVLVGK